MYSKDSTTNMILNFLGPDKITELDSYVLDVLNREYQHFNTKEEAIGFFDNYINELYQRLSWQESDNIKYYTSQAHQRINDILRGKWNYDVSGRLTPEDKMRYQKLAEDIDKIISKSQALPANIAVYRGVGLHPFYDFGITNINDLLSLNGQYLYERGFTSTSLNKDASLMGKSNYMGTKNIEIEYLVPQECQDGMPLVDKSTSYYDEEFEFLLNKSSLVKIVDVQVVADRAYLKAVLIPKHIWDRPYEENLSTGR